MARETVSVMGKMPAGGPMLMNVNVSAHSATGSDVYLNALHSVMVLW
jgi:hypothetical protein